ncbi:MAG: ABC transporter permease [Bacteroidales bacterium]
MIKNYIITAYRSLIQNRVTSAINITGLAAGIAASVLILLYVVSELSVDKFNENYEHIYRLEIGDFIVNGTAPAIILKESFPEIRQTVRLDFRYNPLAAYNDDSFRLEDFIYADSTFFDVFTFQFVRGDPDNALKRPFSLVLTESEAKRIFGNEDPVGRMNQPLAP